MKSPIPKNVNPDIAARFGDIETYHKAKGNVKTAMKIKAASKGKSNQGGSVSRAGNTATNADNSYTRNK